jgi:Amt family ammonium transporter
MFKLRRGLLAAVIAMVLAGPGIPASHTFDLARPAQAEAIPDSTGANTGTIADVTAKEAGKPTLEEVAAEAGHSKVALNIVWTLLAGFLVMFMQLGFAMVETGMCRAKNAGHTFFMNFAVYFLGMLGFWATGYALMMGAAGGISALGGVNVLDTGFTIQLFGKPFQLFGMKGFFLGHSVYDVGAFTLFLFQMVFMDTAATIPTGAMAERWKTSNFIIFSLWMSMLVYPIFGSWVWGGGWLAKLGVNFGLGHGAVDFAGSGVVHLVGGVAALAGAIVIGPRIGKYKDGKSQTIPAHDIPMALAGCMVLAFGWFGFNAGSSLAGGDLRIAVAAVNTMLASASGGVLAIAYMYFRNGGKFDPGMAGNGFLAGLVAITAPCAFVTAPAAIVIGAVAGVLVCVAYLFLDETMMIDDPVGAVAVHCFNGAWGVLSVGLFADGTYGDGWNGVAGTVKGLFYGGGMNQLIAQALEVIACVAWVFPMFYFFFKVTNAISPIRVSKETEIEGLDMPECGIIGYPDFKLK